MTRRRAAGVVLLAAVAVFLASHVRQISDSHYSLLVAEQIVRHGSLDLAEFFREPIDPEVLPGHLQEGLPYQVRRVGDRVLYDFPLGGPLLAVPWVAAARLAGRSVVDADGSYDRLAERRLQKPLAALLAATFLAGLFVALDRVVPRTTALWGVAIVGLASPVWSTASRGLWSHTAALALLGLALPLIVAPATPGRGALRLGVLLAAAFVARPTAALAGLVVVGWLAYRAPRSLVRFAGGAALVALPFVALSLANWGSVLPPYYLASRLATPTLESALGVLLSPGRGLFVYEPLLVVALAYGAAKFRVLERQELFVAGVGGLLLHAAVLAAFPHWWGGHGYGPRLFTEAMFFVALVATSLAATWAKRGPADRAWLRTALPLALVTIAIHGAGAISNRSNRWNWLPQEIDQAPQRLWDWRDPQFLAWRDPARQGSASMGSNHPSQDAARGDER